MTPTGPQRAIPAVAALESSPAVGDDESVVAAQPHAEEDASPKRAGVPRVAAGTGLLAALGLLDQWLQQHGTTLADLTMRSGPLSGSLVANWPIVLLGVAALWWVSDKWQEDRRERAQDRKIALQRAAVQDHHARRQVRAIRAVAEEIVALREAQERQGAEHRGLAGRVDAIERDVRELRGRVSERRAGTN